MLSPGDLHKLVPRDQGGNLRWRAKVLDAAAGDEQARAALVETCSQDILFFINTFVWQFNPRAKGEGELGPFVTWDFQDDAVVGQDPDRPGILWCIEHDEDVLLEKSREMGASWLCLIVLLWLFLFRPWQKFLVISRNEEAVEDDDPDSLFWKLDFMLDHLPEWLLPGGKRSSIRRRKRFFGNPNGSTITGQASTGKAGVGGRATAMFIDEFSQIKEDYEVLHRTSDTTGCRVFNGTHRGLETAFNELADRVDIKKIVMHWTSHPNKKKGLYRWDPKAQAVEVLDKTFHFDPDFHFVTDGTPSGGPFPGLRSPWYDKQCARKGNPRAVAMDLDINPKGSVAQFADAATVRMLQQRYCCDPYWEGDIVYGRDTGQFLGVTPRVGGPLKLWCLLDQRGRPSRKHRVGAGGDLSTGSGATPSCLAGFSADTGEKLFEYVNAHIEPKLLAPLAVALCWMFQDEDGVPARLAWELQGPGIPFGKRVVELGFLHFYTRRNELKRADVGDTETPGWVPTPDNKRMLLEDYRGGLSSRQIVDRSKPCLEEFLSFMYTKKGAVEHGGQANDNDPAGARLNHGDRVIASALGYKMAKDIGFVRAAGAAAGRILFGSLAYRRQIADDMANQSEEAC